MENAEKSILITGCSSGIGLHAAQTLHARGWQVLATARKDKDVARLGDAGLHAFRLDLADPGSVETGAARALDATDGRLFALFNNGAYALPGATEDMPRQAMREIFETNVLGQLDLTNRVLPAMRAQKRGRIIFNSSILGLVAMRYRGPYNATKFALEGFADTMRAENPDPDVHFVLIEPGPITTKIRQNSVPHFERWIDVDTSVHAESYREKLIPRLYKKGAKPDPFELGCEAVTKKLVHALEAPRPKVRYFVTTPTYIAWYLRRLLPVRAIDAIVRRI